MDNINQSKNDNHTTYLSIGGLFFIGIGVYYIFLPYLLNWKKHTSLLPDLIEWAVYAINFLMSSLMIILGIATWYTLKNKNLNATGKNIVYTICLVFWNLNFVYQLVNPTPIPNELILLKIGFLIPPALCIFFYAIPLYRYYEKQR